MSSENYSPAVNLSILPVKPQGPLDLARGGISGLVKKGMQNLKVTGDESLVIYPGELSQISIQLENSWKETLSLELDIDGDLPLESRPQLNPSGKIYLLRWAVKAKFYGLIKYLLPRLEFVLKSKQKLNKILYFFIPNDFFENQSAVDRDRPRLQLDYHVQIRVYAIYTKGEEQQKLLVGEKILAIFVRPPAAYLELLPAFYGERDFMGRFVSIFEETFDPIVQTTKILWAYIDPLTAPKSLLPFLARWVEWPIDPRWDEKRQRQLLRQAIVLYRWRGTRRGLRLLLHLYTGLAEENIQIEDRSNQGFVVGEVWLGPDNGLGGGKAYHIVVTLRKGEEDILDEKLVRQLIEQEKPAFCTYELRIESDQR